MTFPNPPDFYTVEVNKSSWTIPSRYENLTPIGTESHGLICAADDSETGLPVAIKKLVGALNSPGTAKRALQEIQIARAMDHENVMSLTDVFIVDAKAHWPTPIFPHNFCTNEAYDMYIVGPLMGADLAHIQKIQNLSEEHIKFLMYQLLRGLKYLHSAGIVHGDIKPGILGINEDCELKILNFGTTCDDLRKDRKAYMGPRCYQAPEVSLTCFPCNEAADVWSVGCIMAELLTGKVLFPRADHVDRLADMLQIMKTNSSSKFDDSTVADEVRKYVKSVKPKDFDKIFADIDPLAACLIEEMLHLDPSRRLSATQALAHKYFADYHDEDDEPTTEPVTLDVGQECSLHEWREKILEEAFDFRCLQNVELYRKLSFRSGDCATVNRSFD